MGDQSPVVWVLVDHSSRELAFASVADKLASNDVKTEVVTITEIFGSVAKGALSGSAERLVRGLRVAVRGRHQDEDLVGAVRRARPDLLVVTDARYVRALGLLESVSGIPCLQVGVLVDYNLAASWSNSSISAFVVPDEAFKKELTKRGLPEARIQIAGPPIQTAFSAELDRDAIRSELKFGDKKVVLVRADGFDPATIDKLVFQSSLVDASPRFIFHHNGDGTTASALRSAAVKYGLKAAMFGKVDDLERYILAADAVVASPSEPFIAEIIALDRPTVFVGNDGDDSHQVEFLTDRGAAGHISDVLRFGAAFEKFLEESWLESAQAAGHKISTTSGSDDVAAALMTALENRVEWGAPVEKTPPKDDGPNDDDAPDDDTQNDSPFEEIGGENDAPDVDYSGISKGEAKEQLASLILTERDIERKLADAEKEQTRWRSRLEMAREWEEDDLAADAEGVLRGHMDEAKQLQRELVNVGRQKAKLKQAAASPGSGKTADDEEPGPDIADMERRFRKMEVDSDLDNLKDKIKRELGE